MGYAQSGTRSSILGREIGRRLVTEVDRNQVTRLHQKLKHSPYMANRCLAVLSHMMNCAEKWGLRPDGTNPCRHVERYREQKRQRFLSAAELAELGKVLSEVERERVDVIRGRMKGSCLVNLKDPWGRIRKRGEIPGVRVHDLRHSFAAAAAGAGSSLPIIGALLGHTQPQTTARYAHLAADPVRAVAETVGARMAAAMAPKSKSADTVVTFEPKRSQLRRG